VIANAHVVDLLKVVGEILAHLHVVPVQRLDVLHPRRTQLALFDVSVSQDHAQEEQVGRCLGNKLYPWRVEQLSYLQRQESRAIARKPRDAAVIRCGLKFADIRRKFKSRQAPKTRLQVHRRKNLRIGRIISGST